MSDATDALNAIELLRAMLNQVQTEKRYYMAENARLWEELENAPKCEACDAMLDCDECLRADGSHKEHRRLSAENAKLREQGARLFDKMLELGTENAKLRELVRDMCDFFCVVPDEPHVFKEELDFSVEVWKRMRELGVEVDG